MPKHKKRAFAALALLVAALAVGGGVYHWQAAHYAPDVAQWPDQGALVDARHDTRDLLTLFEGEGQGRADFLYAVASKGASQRNPQFLAQVERAARSGVPAGAVHVYDPCITADRQSANFVTIVPREGNLLPPAVMLSKSGDDCAHPVRPAEVESELITFLNQIEMHAGRRAILMPTPAFEAEYGFGGKSARALWLDAPGDVPADDPRRWTLWTANDARQLAGVDAPVGWIVLRAQDPKAGA